MNKSVFRTTFLLFLLTSLFIGAMAQTISNNQTLLWKISGNGLLQDSYIFVTTAPTCQSKITFSQQTETALGKVKLVVFETAVSDKKNENKLKELIQLKNDSASAKNALSAPVYAQLKQKGEEMGINELFLNQYSLLYVAGTLVSLASECNIPNPESMEQTLREYAKKNFMSVDYLLTVEEHFGGFDKYPKAYWEKLMSYMLKNSDKLKAELGKKNTAYTQGNFPALKVIVANSEISKNRYSYLNIENGKMNLLFSRIEAIIKKNPAFITVDAVDVANDPTSILTVLSKAGYNISNVQN